MKYTFTLMLATLLFYTCEVNAKIRRVGYFGTPLSNTDYADLQSAHDAANTNDTLLLYPGNWSAVISKKIVVLGYGYFLTGEKFNANLQTVTGGLGVNIGLLRGADSSLYEGIDGLNVYLNNDEKVSGIVISRCYVRIDLNNEVLDGWHIAQSYINSMSNQDNRGKVTNLRVDNCYIGEQLNLSSGTAGQTGQFTNCIINSSTDQEFGNGSFLLKNCIFLFSHGADANCVYQNCIGNSDFSPIPAGNGNKGLDYFTMQDSVFVGYADQGNFSNDARWALKEGSPAKGAGAGGIDCGIFDGGQPYKLSGIPKTPSFYKVSATSNTTGTNPYTITFSVRSNN